MLRGFGVFRGNCCIAAWTASLFLTLGTGACAEDWEQSYNEQAGVTELSMELTLHAAEEPRPALKYQFLPDAFEQKEGNAAIYYLRAMGFLEQNPVRDELSKVWRAAREEAAAKGMSISDLPPYTWLETPPQELPLDNVKKYLQLTSFQPRDLKVARLLDSFDLDRDIKNVDQPLMVLLPEVQTMRELARNQSLRCRVAIAENRVDDAIEILGQQFALAHHLSDEPFLVSNLVGAAVAGIAWTDSLYLSQLPQAPNLYWAYAALPQPLVDVSRAMAFERQFLFLEIKELTEVDEQPRSVGYWSDFVDRVLPSYAANWREFQYMETEATEMDRFGFVSVLAAAYPGAKAYLLDDLKMDPKLVESYPVAQVVFLAQKRFYEQVRDEFFKWFLVNDLVTPATGKKSAGRLLEEEAAAIGWAGYPATQLLPAVQAVGAAVKRIQLMIGISQTIEAIRLYAAEHEGKLPPDLESLSYPVPDDPYTGKAINYELSGEQGTIKATANGVAYKIVLKIAE